MEQDYTIAETFTLPSNGKLYNGVSGDITLRSMTTADEMKRTSFSEDRYKPMCEMIDDCTVNNVGVSSYDMHISDYQFVLHRLRSVTYGSEYKMDCFCPLCGKKTTKVVNLEELPTTVLNKDLKSILTVTLPKTKHVFELTYQTPRVIDLIEKRKREISKKSQNTVDQSLLITLQYCTKTVDGVAIDAIALEKLISKLPMADTNKLLRALKKSIDCFGVNSSVEVECPGCGIPYDAPFRITGEFFGPEDDSDGETETV